MKSSTGTYCFLVTKSNLLYEVPCYIFQFDVEICRLKKIQDKKRIARKKAEAIKAENVKAGQVIEQAANILDEEDSDLLF